MKQTLTRDIGRSIEYNPSINQDLEAIPRAGTNYG